MTQEAKTKHLGFSFNLDAPLPYTPIFYKLLEYYSRTGSGKVSYLAYREISKTLLLPGWSYLSKRFPGSLNGRVGTSYCQLGKAFRSEGKKVYSVTCTPETHSSPPTGMVYFL